MSMKICSQCYLEKPEDQFFVQNKAKSTLHTECKLCYKRHRALYSAEHYRKYKEQYIARAKLRQQRIRLELRALIAGYLGSRRCEECGEDDLRVLDFDHIDRKNKRFNIAKAVSQGYSWKTIRKEIDKCRVLCANCHRKHTAAQFNWYKNAY